MASAYVPIQGPCIKHAFAKSVYKGEDFWLQNRDVQWTSDSKAGGLLEALGVFDGHGGKGAGQFASKHLMPAVLAGLREGSMPLSTATDASSTAELDPLREELAGGDLDAWQLQDAAVEQLPAALSHAFQQIQKDFFAQSKQSGTTATLVTIVGWDVIVANVGDSCAYLDTGSEVLQVSGNHRLDDAKAERERVEAAGSNVSPSLLDGKPVGPKRVWPGGLAMSRSIGDHEAGAAVLSEPDVRQFVLPEAGGRIIIASDGLWDAINPKTAAHHVRGTPASKAAHDLVQTALKKRGLRDDITVIVIDACAAADDRMPSTLLARKGSGSATMASDNADRVHIRKPLEEDWLPARNEEVGNRRWAAARAMLAQKDDLSSLSSSPWSSTISSLDSSAFQLSQSLEATSSLAALAEEADEDIVSEHEDANAAQDIPISDAEDIQDDDGWETVTKPSHKHTAGQEELDEAVQNLELAAEGPLEPQPKLHKPMPASGRGRGRGSGRSGQTRGQSRGRRGHVFDNHRQNSGQNAAQANPESGPAMSQSNGTGAVRVVPRPPVNRPHINAQHSNGMAHAQRSDAAGHVQQQAHHHNHGQRGRHHNGRGQGRGMRGGRASFTGPQHLDRQNGDSVHEQHRHSHQHREGPPDYASRGRSSGQRGRSNRGRGRGPNRRQQSEVSDSKQQVDSRPGHVHHESKAAATPFQAPVIQFGQFGADV